MLHSRAATLRRFSALLTILRPSMSAIDAPDRQRRRLITAPGLYFRQRCRARLAFFADICTRRFRLDFLLHADRDFFPLLEQYARTYLADIALRNSTCMNFAFKYRAN